MPNIIIKNEYGEDETYTDVNTVKFKKSGSTSDELVSFRYDAGYVPDTSLGSGMYAIKFIDFDGLLIKIIYVDEGDSIDEDIYPTPPEREGYEFQEWTEMPSSIDTSNITKNITIGAIRGWIGS